MSPASSNNLRVVSLAPSVTAILCALGAGDCLVGVTRWCAEVAPIGGLPLFDDCWNADPEKVAALHPDLVIGSVPYRLPVIEGILKRGLNFLAMSPRCLQDVYADIDLLARLTGRAAEGERLIAGMQARLHEVRVRVASCTHRPRIYCEEWSNPLQCSQAWVQELVEAAGGVFVPIPAGRKVSSEEVIAADPEIIVLAWCGTNDRARPEAVLRRPGWESIHAARAGRIHVVRDELLNTPGPNLIAGLEALAIILHPEIFGEPIHGASV